MASQSPTDFDIKAFALDKAVATHGYAPMGSQGMPDPDDIVAAAEKYEAFLRTPLKEKEQD